VRPFYSLAKKFRRSAQHESSNDNREHDEDQHAVEARADATEYKLAALHIDQ
jgi:hypothetical protein